MSCQSLKSILLFFFIFCVFLTGIEAKESTLPCQVYFSPQDQLDERLIALIEKEKVSIQAAIYCLMHRKIAQALTKAKDRGVLVEVVVDSFSVKAASPISSMAEKGVSIYVWNKLRPQKKSKKKSLMHDKFCVFGNHTVWTGSFNFTRDASFSNCENAVVLSDQNIAELYKVEFEKIKSQGSIPYKEFCIERKSGK